MLNITKPNNVRRVSLTKEVKYTNIAVRGGKERDGDGDGEE